MITGTCHCGALRVEVPSKPSTITDCNCSVCRRYGTLWAYYKANTVRVVGTGKRSYSWGRKHLRFVRCGTCGCITHWEGVHPPKGARVGVNWRNFEPGLLKKVRVRQLDGAHNWKARYLNRVPHAIA
ncbi:MAG TPA: hypothetical protein VKB41_11355 [Steroidobacteraceae bacterium]|jgi:hypothetical protein|nr:hypothetical protein [Steroidobacteraceae bacterium]